MSDDEVIDLAGSEDEQALAEEDEFSLRNFGLPVEQQQQQSDADHVYITTPVTPITSTTSIAPITRATQPTSSLLLDADAAYAAMLQRREIEVAEEEEKAKTAAPPAHFVSSSSDPSQPILTSALQSELISQHREKLYSTDPHVPVHDLFVLYSQLLFHDSLAAVSVRWSNRMTVCAGLCKYDTRAGGCEIALSESLLRYRSKQEVVETLIHEMIHAYLFVGDTTQRDHDAHGPNFCMHMSRINQLLGLRISVYHTFHAEVKLYKRFVWQCQGKCQNWKPYFGKVSRSMNRKPGLYDSWFKQHQANCGGYFVRIAGPTEEELKAEKKEKERRKRAEKKAEKARKEKRDGLMEDEKQGVRQTDLRDSMTTTPKKRKTASKKKKKGPEDETKEGENAATDNVSSAETKKKHKPRRSKKKFPGKGHVLGGGEEAVGGRKKRQKKANDHLWDDGSGSDSWSAASEDDDGANSSQPSVAEHQTPSSSAAASSSPTSSLQPTTSSVPSGSTVFPPPPSQASATTSSNVPSLSFTSSSSSGRSQSVVSTSPVSSSSPSGAAGKPATASASTPPRRRTTNVFDLMAARGDRSKVDNLVNKAKQ